jgi:hypothetical protein
MVGECPKRTGESCLLLIFGVHRDLIISRITIQERIISMLCQVLHHLINERKWEMILPSGGIQLTVVYTYSPSKMNTSWHQLTFLVLYYRQSNPLWHNMNRSGSPICYQKLDI